MIGCLTSLELDLIPFGSPLSSSADDNFLEYSVLLLSEDAEVHPVRASNLPKRVCTQRQAVQPLNTGTLATHSYLDSLL